MVTSLDIFAMFAPFHGFGTSNSRLGNSPVHQILTLRLVLDLQPNCHGTPLPSEPSRVN